MNAPSSRTAVAESGGLAEALAEALPRLCAPGTPVEPAVVELIGALARALEGGALEVDFNAAVPDGLAADHWPETYRQAAHGSSLVARAPALADAPEAPLVLAGDRLRWRRWHQQLESTLDLLVARAQGSTAPPPAGAAPSAGEGLDAQQQRAVTAARCHGLLLLSGGPGTGKTSTVVQLLADQLADRPTLRVHLAAPTGKAAARLREALERCCSTLPAALAARVLAAPCSTLHRLLECQGERFGRHRGRPLELDLLVVDELSMVDLPLMAALLDALPAACRLVLVGDPDQLAPVGPGAVLQELLQPDRRAQLGPAAVELRTTYRYGGAIAAITAELRRAGPISLAVLEPKLRPLDAQANLQWLQAAPEQPPPLALAALIEHQQRLAALASALPMTGEAQEGEAQQSEAQVSEAMAALLTALEACVLLTPRRQGRWGVEGLHRQLLGDAAARPCSHWPLGTPVLNRRNLPDHGLANGDVGVLVGPRQARRVLFADGRQLHPALLGQAEPALALTVHKAQGSQYGTVWLLLPPGRDWDARLLYTGLSRARERAWLVTPCR